MPLGSRESDPFPSLDYGILGLTTSAWQLGMSGDNTGREKVMRGEACPHQKMKV